jgi:hypothetical protein
MTAMFSPTGWFAHFGTGHDDERAREVPVVAFKPSALDAAMPWTAMIVDTSTGTLRAASSFPDFSHLVEGSRITAVLPAEGWQVEHCHEDGSGAFTTPVLGWIVDDKGAARPIHADPTGTEILDNDAAYRLQLHGKPVIQDLDWPRDDVAIPPMPTNDPDYVEAKARLPKRGANKAAA